MRSYIILLVVWITCLFSVFSVIYTKSCQRFRPMSQVRLRRRTSNCHSYESYTSPRPCYFCVVQCHTTPGCVAVECDSKETTSRCCMITDKSVNIFEGSSTIIHKSNFNICLGSDWTGEFTTSDFTMKMRFPGLGHNCSRFSGNAINF